MTTAEESRLRQIIRKQNIIKLKARAKRNLRILERAKLASLGPAPKLLKGRRVKDRHVLQMVLGSLSDRWVKIYNEAGITAADVTALANSRPAVKAKLQALGVVESEGQNG
jgi:hypothetical protein